MTPLIPFMLLYHEAFGHRSVQSAAGGAPAHGLSKLLVALGYGELAHWQILPHAACSRAGQGRHCLF